MIEQYFTGVVFNENGEPIGCSQHFLGSPEYQLYDDFVNKKSYKRMKTNDVWNNWLEVIA